MLLGITQAGFLCGNNIAAVKGFFPHQDAKEGGLAAAVAAHKPHLFVFLYVKGHILKQDALPKIFAHMMCRQDDHDSARSSPVDILGLV